jgi:hypothetical protein
MSNGRQFQTEDLKMRRFSIFALALFALIVVPNVNFSQGGQTETSRGVEGGGIQSLVGLERLTPKRRLPA